MDSKDKKLLTLAIGKNSLQSAKKVLKKNKGCLKDTDESYLLLVEALDKKCIGIAKLLLKNGCKVKSDVKTKDFDMPLCYAVSLNNAELIKLLLGKGVSVNSITRQYKTALFLAFKEKNYEVCKTLLSSYFTPSNWLSSTNSRHSEAYFIARLTKNKDAVKEFSRLGLFSVHRGLRGLKLAKQKLNLDFAVDGYHSDLLNLLLISGADTLQKNKAGLTPLDKSFENYVKEYPILSRTGEKVNSVLKYTDSTVNHVGNNGVTLFHMACSINTNDCLHIAENFLNNNVDVNQQIPFDSEKLAGYTPLHCATHFACLDQVRLLLKHNADVNVLDKNGMTPFHSLLKSFSCKKNSRLLSESRNVEKLRSFVLPLVAVFMCKIVDINSQISIESEINPGYTLVHCAVDANDKLLFVSLLSEEPNLFLKDAQGLSPLHLAWTKFKSLYKESEQQECNSIIQFILMWHLTKNDIAFLNEKDPVYFHIACTKSILVADSIQKGVDVNSRATLDSDLSNCTPLHCAVQYNNSTTVELLIKNGADIHLSDENNYTALYRACKLFCDESVRKIKHLHDLCEREESVLFMLEFYGQKFQESIDWDQNLKIIELLLELGSDANAKDKEDNPMHFLFFSTEISDMLEYFATKSLSRNQNNSNQNILNGKEFCKQFVDRRQGIVKLLLDHNADVNLPDGKGTYLLHQLIERSAKGDGNLEIAEMILKKKANIDVVDNNSDEKWTPVQLAVMRNSTNFIRLLIKYKADINTSYENNTTLLHTVCIGTGCRSSVINLLVSKNININAKDEDGKTPLFYACQQHPNTCLELLKHGADVNVTDKNYETIFHEIFQDFGSLRYEIFGIIRDHIHKLRLINSIRFYASKKIDDECSRLEQKYREYLMYDEAFLDKCEDELRLMKSVQVNNYSSLYDFLYKDLNQMARYTKNTAFTSVLNSHDFKNKYPLFGYFLKLQLKEGAKRESLLEPAKKALSRLSLLKLSDLCSENIFKYCDNQDVKNLLKVF